MAIIDRIKFDGLASREWLVYHFPGEEFVTGSQLIVGEGQIAVFLKGGKAVDFFEAGTHTLSTSNLPLIQGLVNLPFGGQTPFTAEIYFINKITKLDMTWGTKDPIQIVDPKYKIKLRVRGFGQFGVKIDDYRVFLTELIGSIGSRDAVSFDKVCSFFDGILITKIKTIIASAIIDKSISVLEISAKLDEISSFGLEKIRPEFEKYGLRVANFFVESINFPDEDFDKINSLLGDRAAFDIMGDSRYVAKRSFDVLETTAKNEGTGNTMSAGIGLGIGVGVGNAMGGAMGQIASNINTNIPSQTNVNTTTSANNITAVLDVIKCSSCGTENSPASKFCMSCGNKTEPLSVICNGCNFENLKSAKFCCNCGLEIQKGSKCQNCGTKFEEYVKFCNNCGTNLEV